MVCEGDCVAFDNISYVCFPIEGTPFLTHKGLGKGHLTSYACVSSRFLCESSVSSLTLSATFFIAFPTYSP